MEGGVGVTKEKKNIVIVENFSLSFLKVIQVLILKRLMLVNKMVVLVSKVMMVFANKMMNLVHLLANIVVTGRLHHAIAVIVVVAKGMMVHSALFARIMNQKYLPPVWYFGSTARTVETGYTMCVPLD